MACMVGFLVLQWTLIMALIRWTSGKDSPSWQGVGEAVVRWVRTGRLTEPLEIRSVYSLGRSSASGKRRYARDKAKS
jgi:hypothetical protein